MNMTPTKDQQAKEYVEKQLSDICLMLDYEENKQIGYFHTYDIQKAYIDGYTACEQSMWRSVEEELPEPDTMCLVFGYQDLDFNGRLTRYTMMAWYDGEDFMDAYNDRKYHPEKWMAIPLPDTNTEKK